MSKKHLVKKRLIIIEENVECTTNEYIGNQIKIARTIKKITQQELAEKLDLSRASVANIEGGKQALTVNVLENLCEIFEKSSKFFFPF